MFSGVDGITSRLGVRVSSLQQPPPVVRSLLRRVPRHSALRELGCGRQRERKPAGGGCLRSPEIGSERRP